MRALLRIEGSDGSATSAPCNVTLHLPMVRVELDANVALQARVSYHMMLLRESGAPLEHVEVFNTDRPLSAPISIKAIDLTLDDLGVRGWREWTAMEDRMLRKLAATGSTAGWIALELGRTVEDVRRRAGETDVEFVRV